jgi:hypothetical protein
MLRCFYFLGWHIISHYDNTLWKVTTTDNILEQTLSNDPYLVIIVWYLDFLLMAIVKRVWVLSSKILSSMHPKFGNIYNNSGIFCGLVVLVFYGM